MPSTIKQAADEHAGEILARLKDSERKREAALVAHPAPITVRTEAFQDQIATAAPALFTATIQTAGYLLAVGDSWFDYPLHDILTRLEDEHAYNIESAAHRGDPIELMVSRVGQLDKFGRCMLKMQRQGATPKAILISGGGDDIAGKEFGMLINSLDLVPIAGWNDQILTGVIETRIAAAYRLLFQTLNIVSEGRYQRTFPILVHGYDYPVPDGRGFLGGAGFLPGPWLKPGFDEKQFADLSVTTAMMKTIIDRFNAMLQRLVQEPENANVIYIDLRGTLSNAPTDYKDWWANELHANGGGIFGGQDGWGAIAAKFQSVLANLP